VIMIIEAMRQAVDALDEAANVLTSRMFADSATVRDFVRLIETKLKEKNR